MVSTRATTVAAYLAELPADRRKEIAAVRKVVKAHMPKGYVEEMRWFEDGFKKAGKKLNMGKSCVCLTTADDLPLTLIGAAIAKIPLDKCIAMYHESHPE